MSTGALQDLIDRLEKAEEGSHVLDTAIHIAVGRERDFFRETGSENGVSYFLPDPPYTTSLDAALTLVPEGYGAVSASINERGKSSARIGHPYVHGNGATPALALCIAALRARAATVSA